MSNRELFHATMRRENGGKLLHMEQGFNIIYEQWLADGLPRHVAMTRHPEITEGENLQDHMNVAGYLMCRVNQFCIPEFEGRIIEEKDGRRIALNGNGVTSMTMTSGFGSPPHEIDFIIKTPRDYEENRFRFTWHSGEPPTMAIATTPGDWRSMVRQTWSLDLLTGVYDSIKGWQLCRSIRGEK